MMLTKAQAAKAHFKGDKKSIDLLWLHGTQFVHKIVRKLESVNLLTIEKAEAEAAAAPTPTFASFEAAVPMMR